MKLLLAALLAAGVALVVFGSPFADPASRRAPSFGGSLPVLPMTFAHGAHGSVGCVMCHHEFVDRTLGQACMTCHVTDHRVAPRLEDQFHTLCRSCHMREHAAGKPAGPTRHCRSCHLPDGEF